MNKKDLLNTLSAMTNGKVAVVGDLMLDQYIWGEADRISQEAPVPVVRVSKTNEAPGGAANVAGNILGLGGAATIFGTVGTDAEGDRLETILRERGADVSGIVHTTDRPTTVKTRVIANHQQVVRIDAESSLELATNVVDELEKRIVTGIEHGDFQGIVFEDYAKGLLTQPFIQRILDAARAHGIVCALDPHPSHPFEVHGLHLITPNRAEAFGLAGAYYRPGVLPLENDLPLLDVGRRLQSDWNAENLLITLGGDGMALFAEDGVTHIPTRAREVFDVSGAGDTVTAAFVLAMLTGATPVQAAHLSNYAAGIVVAKVGTTPVTAKELRDVLEAL
jgi:rfaE bifunctional protein kinase chain/domain